MPAGWWGEWMTDIFVHETAWEIPQYYLTTGSLAWMTPWSPLLAVYLSLPLASALTTQTLELLRAATCRAHRQRISHFDPSTYAGHAFDLAGSITIGTIYLLVRAACFNVTLARALDPI